MIGYNLGKIMNSKRTFIKKGIIYERIIHDGYYHQLKIHVEILQTRLRENQIEVETALGMGTASSSILTIWD